MNKLYNTVELNSMRKLKKDFEEVGQGDDFTVGTIQRRLRAGKEKASAIYAQLVEEDKKILGEFRLFNRQGMDKIEKSGDMDDATEIIFIGMLIEYLAHKHKLSPEVTVGILLDGINKWPASFEDDEPSEGVTSE
ncbi:hypothetical protein [Enterococcus termitis]|uniref:Uncharacterized protein n=1 Tax=Enterococcus termitis TaxID=332950 RepID=A0A1E5GIP0_9ENTE|nr:hypothetical protein [Enterococcus termitis]OEG12481.1 hypothetical protein BCR25_08060 [Enterococcus termitis]